MKKRNSQNLNTNALLLPMKDRVIFVDWFGVLSNEVFWQKYLDNSTSKWHNKIAVIKDKIFSNKYLVEEWMKGNYTYEDILNIIEPNLSVYEKKVLKNSVNSYCSNLILNESLVAILKNASRSAFIVLATDNMDCFFNCLFALPQLGLFDSILSSNNLGILKKEDPERFFGQWLKNHNIPFENAILVDDSILNCREFKKHGGSYLQYTDTNRDLLSLINWANQESV